jgi:hypothetical protein
VLVQTADGFATACARNTLVIARVAAPVDFKTRCRPMALLDQVDLERRGGAMITESARGFVIARASPDGVHRAWTPVVADEDAAE